MNKSTFFQGKAKRLLISGSFNLCVVFLEKLGKCLGLSYKQMSVYFNLYLQGVLLLLSGVIPCIASIIRFVYHPTWLNGIMICVFLVYASIFVIGFLCGIRHYSGNTDLVFDKCVKDLNVISKYCHLSYQMVNLIIFVMWWTALVAVNIILFLLLL